MITAADIVDIVFSRNISADHFRAADVSAGKIKHFRNHVGRVLFDKVAETPGDYTDFLNDYAKPAISYGVAVDCFESVRTEITDRGVNVFTGEGIVGQADAASALKKELALKRDFFVREMIAQARENYADDFQPQAGVNKEIYHVSQRKRSNHI